MSDVANNNLTLSHTATAATIAKTNVPSLKNFTSTFATWFDKISLALSAVQTAIIINGDGVGAGDILATANKVSENGKKVLRVGDQVIISCTGTQPNTIFPFIPPNIPAVDNVTVTIQSAGQNKVSAQ